MKTGLLAISVLLVAGLAAGFVFPPDTSTASPVRAAVGAAAPSGGLDVGGGVVGAASASGAAAATTSVHTGVEVSVGDVIGVIGILLAGVVVVAIWVRSRHPVTRITHRRDDRERWGRG